MVGIQLHLPTYVKQYWRTPQCSTTRAAFNPKLNWDNFPTNTTPRFNYSSMDTTTSTNTLDAIDNQRLSETINKIFRKTLIANLSGKDKVLKEVRDCILRNTEAPSRSSFHIYNHCEGMSVKNECLFIDACNAITKAIKEAVLEDIHSTQLGHLAMLSLASIWWPYMNCRVKNGHHWLR